MVRRRDGWGCARALPGVEHVAMRWDSHTADAPLNTSHLMSLEFDLG
jgi:hypothetical protein